MKGFNYQKIEFRFLVMCLFFTISLNAQIFQWAKQAEGNLSQTIAQTYLYHMAADVNENIYLAGRFHNTFDLDMNGTLFNVSTPDGKTGVFISKYNNQGNFLWGFSLGSETSDDFIHCYINDLTVDANGNIIIVGKFETAVNGGIDFNPGSASEILNSAPNADAGFIAKYDTNGNLTWAFRLMAINSVNGNPQDWDQEINGIAADVDGNIFVTGRINSDNFAGIDIYVDINPLDTAYQIVEAGSIVAKYNANGLLQWYRIFENPSENIVQGSIGDKLSIDSDGNIYNSGIAAGSVNFGNGYNYTTSEITPADYLVKLDAAGNTSWLIILDNDIPNNSQMESKALFTTSGNDILFAGRFNGTVDFDPGPGSAALTSFESNPGVFDQDAFIVRYNSAGEFKWVSQIGGGLVDDFVASLIETNHGSVFATGSGEAGFFLVEYNAQNGNQESVYTGSNAIGYGLSNSGNNNMYLMGVVSGDSNDSLDVDFGSDEYKVGFSSQYTDALFIARYDITERPTDVESHNHSGIPEILRLDQNYPNPFNPGTNIQFSLPEASFVKLNIFNIQGEEVADLVNSELSAGNYKVDWKALEIPSGVYIYVLRTKDMILSRKMLLLK
jgi:hypothetical protein